LLENCSTERPFMADAASSLAPQPQGATGVLVLADGTVLWGVALAQRAAAVGEVCFNTAMTGYQEVMTDPSYAAQIVTFTFPHIGNVGVNDEDLESHVEGAVGCVVREDVTAPSSFRSRRVNSARGWRRRARSACRASTPAR
jgi:carbamoyl-phosphate synthase small subunit